jgi:hypothetical protein
MRRSSRRLAAVGTGLVCVAGLTLAAPTTAGAGTSITTVIPGLNAPRGIVFDGNGNMYVAQSGTAGSGPAGLTHTGSVSKYRWGSTTAVWSTSFESLFVTEDPTQPPDVLGPEGLSVLDRSCLHHEPVNCALSLITSESHDGAAAATGGAVQTTQAGHLFRINRGTGVASDRSDVGDQDYKFTGDHVSLFPDDFPDANPYGVLVTTRGRHEHDHGDHHGDRHYSHHGDRHHGDDHGRIRTFVADAGANTIDEIMPGGTIRVIAYIPNETTPPLRDATPTCIAQGRDGYLYVGTLDLVAGEGRANVYKVDPEANFPTKPKLWATGLTSITSCTFDRHGDFWATEMFADAGATAPPGDVVRIDEDNPHDIDHFGLGQLPLPGGITQGPDGAMYVTVNSANPAPGSGAVVRLEV